MIHAAMFRIEIAKSRGSARNKRLTARVNGAMVPVEIGP
jgi:hypothetical protein